MPKKKFCASPWVELVLVNDGRCQPCCKNGTFIGDWTKSDLHEIWAADVIKKMRESIIAGLYPDKACKFCNENNNYANLERLLKKPLHSYCEQLKPINPFGLMRLANLSSLFDKTENDDYSDEVLTAYFEVLGKHSIMAKRLNNSNHNIISNKLRVIGEIVQDFLSGSTAPRNVGPIREPNLISICNARCIHCPGNFTNVIRDGILGRDGEHIPFISEENCRKTLQSPECIIDFFMNGSEFLLYKHWKMVASELAINNLVKIRVSTNGMLLTPLNSDYLLDNDCIGKLNVSLDGGTAKTIAKVRGRVVFDVVHRNIKYFMEKNLSTNRRVPISFSFVLCSYNYKELKEIVMLAHELAHDTNSPPPVIVVQPMATHGCKNYGEWLSKHHHSKIDHDDLVRSFNEMADTATRYGVRVVVFHHYTIEEFIRKDYPLPPYQFCQLD